MADPVIQILKLAFRYAEQARDEATVQGELGIAEGCQASADALKLMLHARARNVYVGGRTEVQVTG